MTAGINAGRRVHCGLLSFKHRVFTLKTSFALKPPCDFNHCQVPFRSVNNNRGIRGITNLPLEPRMSEHPFGRVSPRLPQSGESLSCLVNKNELGIFFISLLPLCLQDFSGDNESFERRLSLDTLNTMAVWLLGDNERLWQRLEKKIFHLNAVPQDLFGEISV